MNIFWILSDIFFSTFFIIEKKVAQDKERNILQNIKEGLTPL